MTLLIDELPKNPKILLVRLDGIGDLICLTPAIVALRQRFPDAQIDVLVNEYNGEILRDHPAINHLLIDYRTRDRHTDRRRPLQSFKGWWQRMRMRQQHYDVAIAAHFGIHARSLWWVRQIRPKHIIQSVEPEWVSAWNDGAINIPAIWGCHETQATYKLLEPLGIHGQPGPLSLSLNQVEAETFTRSLRTEFPPTAKLVGLNITASVAERRWPIHAFIELAKSLRGQFPEVIWVPIWLPNLSGGSPYGQTPGDDEALYVFQQAFPAEAIRTIRTDSLQALLMLLAACDLLVTSDGGVLHMAAALQKPIVGLFQSLTEKTMRWYPWGVPHILVQAERLSAPVNEIRVVEVTKAVKNLLETI